MVSKELKRLSRRALVDVIYQMKKNEQELKEEIDSLQTQLQDKRIRISVAGSLAEAAADVTQLLSVAQMTADLYLREINSMKADAEKESAKIIEDAHKKAEKILEEGERQFAILNARYQAEYQKLQQLLQQVKQLQEGSEHEEKN